MLIKRKKIINICKQFNATVYISGPASKTYFDQELANKENILVEWMNYENYKEYEQLYPPFDHGVSILDLIFNIDATKFIKNFTQ